MVALAGGVETLRKGTARLAETRQSLETTPNGFERAHDALEGALRTVAELLAQAGDAGAPFIVELDLQARTIAGS